MIDQCGPADAPGIGDTAAQGQSGEAEEIDQVARLDGVLDRRLSDMGDHGDEGGFVRWLSFQREVVGGDQVEQRLDRRFAVDQPHRVARVAQAHNVAMHDPGAGCIKRIDAREIDAYPDRRFRNNVAKLLVEMAGLFDMARAGEFHYQMIAGPFGADGCHGLCTLYGGQACGLLDRTDHQGFFAAAYFDLMAWKSRQINLG